jgi:hypothetical protein
MSGLSLATAGLLAISVSSQGCVRPPTQAAHGDAGLDAGSGDAGNTALPDAGGYQPVALSAALTKVKNLLVGSPASDAEVAAVQADPSALSGLVGQWMAMPQYNAKMLQFFANAFQQSAVTQAELAPQFSMEPPFERDQPEFMEDVEQSFARTALELIAEGKPFTSTMTTTRFMMTPALMAAYAELDALPTDDEGNTKDLFAKNTPVAITLQSATMVPIEEAIDPTSPHYMMFTDPSLATSYDANCPVGTATYPAPASARDLQNFLFDRNPHYFLYDVPGGPTGYRCYPPAYPESDSYLESGDYTTWQMVTIRAPNPGEATTRFYDLPALRSGADLVLNVPRVGFFTTLSFLGQWATNQSNLARVTLNQTMIVGLGKPIDETNTTMPGSLAALDENHAAPGTTCFACHMTLDPMRQFFRQAYTLTFSRQQDASEMSIPGQFAFHGVSAPGTTIFDLGTQLAAHPMFATAWVQKLCTYANSAPCDEGDPEFMRLVSLFTSSNFSWNALVQALFSSPIVTNLAETKTADTVGETFPIARQEHLCATLSTRLNIPDVCGLDANTEVPGALSMVQSVASSWPSDQYSRGNPTPVLANAPSMFMRAGMENICSTLAIYLVDNHKTGQFSSTNALGSIQNFATNLMGLGSDRSGPAIAILQSHFTNAMAQGATATQALQSTFVLACLSPSVIGIGQ